MGQYTGYIEGAAGLGLIWYGFKRGSGLTKWGLIAVGAYLAYSAYTELSPSTTS